MSTRFQGGPYTPMIDTLPPLRTVWIAQLIATGTPACMKLFPRPRCSLLPSASIPTASITTSGPRPSNWSFRKATTSGTFLKFTVPTPASARQDSLAAAGDVRIPVNPARHVAVRARVLAIRGEAARAIKAAAAGDVERHHHPVATPQVFHRLTGLQHRAREFVSESAADARVGN